MLRERYGKHFNIALGLNLSDGATPALRAVSTPDGRVSGLLCSTDLDGPDAPLIICVHGIGSNGRYFDLRNNSFALAAARRGIATLLIDRPGYGGSAVSDHASAIDSGVDAIGNLIAHVYKYFAQFFGRPLALVGHSFGGAIALTYAARGPADSIAAICVSGVGDRASEAYLVELMNRSSRPSGQLSPHWFFGPGRTYDRHGVTALRSATEPHRSNEIHEVAFLWPTQWVSVVERIACPVHFRLAEHENIWQATQVDIERIAAGFTSAARVDAAILPDGGHLYDAHLRGHELFSAQLDFVQNFLKQRT